MTRAATIALFAFALTALPARAAEPIDPILRVVDLDIGEGTTVTFPGKASIAVRLVKVDTTADPIRKAVRRAVVTVDVGGVSVTLRSGNYELPKKVDGVPVQIDCPVVGEYRANTTVDHWGLVKAARLRLWQADSPWIAPGSFVFPAKQRWLASMTQMANEPTYVDGGESPVSRKIYYHSGLDIGGAEGLVDVVAATDGLVVSSGNARLPGHDDSPVAPRYDVVYLLDGRGWYYRYSHLKTIDPAMTPGAKVKMGQRLGVLGKEGGSGGWSHLHFEVKSRQPSGRWGTQEGYAFLWQAALAEQKPEVVAVARPHHLVRAGDSVTLDGSKSWSRAGSPATFEWAFSDGTKSVGPRVERRYDRPGMFSETLKVTDVQGRTAYDFAVVQVIDPSRPEALPPTIHAAFSPTAGIGPNDPVTFKVRTFRVGRDGGSETWDFGDGSPPVRVQSDGNARQHDPEGYAVTTHAFAKPGDYIVSVSRSDRAGQVATARLWVRVE